jgi:hypothetical protein
LFAAEGDRPQVVSTEPGRSRASHEFTPFLEGADNVGPHTMITSPRILSILCAAAITMSVYAAPWAADGASVSSVWKITSIKVCKDSRGYLEPHVDALGSFPVYSFFIPRPVWTVNGIVVEAQPAYDRGRLVSFRLMGAAPVLRSGTKNTIKLSLPDQNAAKIFRFDAARVAPGDCYEFF